jgi:thiol-disulfide isomerase/thioredoxin
MRIFFLFFFFLICSLKVQSQLSYTITADAKTGWLMFKGLIDKQILINEPSFYWYANTHTQFQPDSAFIQAMRWHKDSTKFILFGGTWCDDTQSILPRFFKLQELAGVPDSSISFFAVDRNKHSISNVPQAFGITHVPTIVLLRNGKELGRLVEYGPKGDWNAAFLELLRITKQP